MRSLLLLTVIPVVLASYCGQSAIPFTFQVLRSGHPVLGCARPKCFGWTANGSRAGDSAQFYRVAGKEDGYLRRSDQFLRKPSKSANFVPQIAMCSDNFKSSSCESGEWVGGLSPQSDPLGTQMQLRCCSYQVLMNSQDRGVATVKQGQLVVGGEVLENGKLVAFDYIANLNKEISANGTITYFATLKRMSCFDEDQVEAQTEIAPKPEGGVNRPETKVVKAEINDQPPQQQPQPQSAPVQPTPVAAQFVPSGVEQTNLVQQPAQQFAAPTQQFNGPPQQFNGQQYVPQQQGAVYGNGVNNGNGQYGQFTQQGYGVAQNGQYQAYPQYQQPQQYQVQQVPAQLQQQPQQFQDPFAAMFQQQQQMQQQVNNQPQMGFTPLPPFPKLSQNQPSIFPQMQQFPLMPPGGAEAGAGAGAPAAAQVPATSTIPTLNLPKIDELPKLQIPSVEDVEQVIPPMQRAILTSVAKFFGVL